MAQGGGTSPQQSTLTATVTYLGIQAANEPRPLFPIRGHDFRKIIAFGYSDIGARILQRLPPMRLSDIYEAPEHLIWRSQQSVHRASVTAGSHQ